MFCSTNRLIERCHLLYIFIAVAILLLIFCIYLYKRHSTRMKDENNKIVNDKGINKNPIDLYVEEIPEILESAGGEPELIRKPFENGVKNENVKENDKEAKNIVEIETIDETNEEVIETTVNE